MDEFINQDCEWMWSESWKTKPVKEWTMQEAYAYEFQKMCEEHDKLVDEA